MRYENLEQKGIPRKRNLLYEMLLKLSGIEKRIALSDREINEKITEIRTQYLPFLASFPNFLKGFIKEMQLYLKDKINIAEIENKEILGQVYERIKSLEIKDEELKADFEKLLNLIKPRMQISEGLEIESEEIIQDIDQILQYLLITLNRIDKKLSEMLKMEPSERVGDNENLFSRIREVLGLIFKFDRNKNDLEELISRIKSLNSELKYKEASFSFALISRSFNEKKISLERFLRLLETKIRAEIIRATIIFTLKQFGAQTIEQIEEKTRIEAKELMPNCIILLDRKELFIIKSDHKNLIGLVREYPKLYRFISKEIQKVIRNKEKISVFGRSILNAIAIICDGVLEKILKIGPESDKIYAEELQNLSDKFNKINQSFESPDLVKERETQKDRIKALIELYDMFRVKMVHEKEPYLIERSQKEEKQEQLNNFILTAMKMDFERGLLLSILKKKGPASIKDLAKWSNFPENKIVHHVLKMVKDKIILTKGTENDYFKYDISRIPTDLETGFLNTCQPLINLVQSFFNLLQIEDLRLEKIRAISNGLGNMSENLKKLLEIDWDSKVKKEMQIQLDVINSILQRSLELDEKIPMIRSEFDLTKLAMMSLPRVDEKYASLIKPEYLVGFGDIEWNINKCLSCASCQEICPESAVNLINEWDLPAVFEMSEEDLENLPENRRMIFRLIKKLAVKKPTKSIKIPKDTLGFGKIEYNPLICIACRKCEERCPTSALTFHEYWNFPQIMKTLLEKGES